MRNRRTLSTARRHLPVVALVLAAFVGIALLAFAFVGSKTDRAEAATTGAAMSMSVAAGQATLCPFTKVNGETCIPFGAKFDVIVSADAIPTGATSASTPGYSMAPPAWLPKVSLCCGLMATPI